MMQISRTVVTQCSLTKKNHVYSHFVSLLCLSFFFILYIITYLQLPPSLIFLSWSLFLPPPPLPPPPPLSPPLSPPALLSVFAPSPARSLSVSDKERFILSGSADCYVKIWALNIGMLNHTDRHRHTDIYVNIYITVEVQAPQGCVWEMCVCVCIIISVFLCDRWSVSCQLN